MAQSDAEESFKVTDRRRRGEEASASPAAAPRGAEEPAPTPPSTPRVEPGAPGAAPTAERSLVGLFVTLASEAFLALGEPPDAATPAREPDFGHAAQLIDLLMLLRDRTEGRRTAQESEVLEGFLYDLQVRFVTARRRAG